MSDNNTPAISVIVPIYNVERYLPKCLKSICNQSFTNFEALLIDDGSQDNSAAIAQKICDTDKRFHIIHKENGGLSDARNVGLQHAKGEFVVFIDSDDYIHTDYLSVLYNACIQNNADMSYCRFKYSYFKTGITLKARLSSKTGVFDKEEALDMLIRDNILHSYAWNKMYRRTLFTENNITYPKMFFEDIATSAKVLFHAKKLAVTNQYLYYYVKHFHSIMSTMNAVKINDYLRSILIVRNYIQLQGAYETYKDAIYAFAKKAHAINVYSIVRQHLLYLDFKNIRLNLQTNDKIFNYITSDTYEPIDGNPQLPFFITQPGKKEK
ncbi:MAG: glycosyltransferase [Acutalibacteraceae bacterium]